MSAAPVPQDGEPHTVLLAFWDCGHIEVDRGVEHRCDGRDVCTATFVRHAPVAAGRAAATPDPPTDERRPWPIAPDTVMPPRRQPVRWGSRADDPPTEIHDDPGKTKAYLAGLAAGRTEAAAASPDERLREALRDANEYLAQIADYSPSEVADAIDSVRAQIKDALAATDSRGKPDGASVPDQSCATCGGSGDRNGNRRAADPFGTCPGCGGTGNVAAADREASLEPAPQNDETRAQIVAAKLIADREAPDEP